MVTIIILLVLGIGAIVGFRRGLVLQIAHLFSFFLSLIFAYKLYEPFSKKIMLWIPFPINLTENNNLIFDLLDIEKAYYRAIAFIIILIVVKIAFKIIASVFDFLASIPLVKTTNRILGAIIGFIEMYIILTIILIGLAFIPNNTVQNALQNSFLAMSIIKYSPFLSGWLKSLWI